MQHTIRAFDEELARLRTMIAEMGGLAELQLSAAIEALESRDPERALAVAKEDRKIDALEVQAENLVVQIIARRSPVAEDLREIIAALKMSSMLERIGDAAKNIAKRVPVIVQSPPIRAAQTIPRMADEARQMVNQVLDAYVERDSDKAVAVWSSDDRVDRLYNTLFRDLLTDMAESPQTVTAATHLIFVAKNIERIGDQATNIAEEVYYLIEGERLDDRRPKADATTEAAVASGNAREGT
ncbi:MAG: phosphate signaling complex protein PhoU [Rhodothalassiaceae bacterium]